MANTRKNFHTAYIFNEYIIYAPLTATHIVNCDRRKPMKDNSKLLQLRISSQSRSAYHTNT